MQGKCGSPHDTFCGGRLAGETGAPPALNPDFLYAALDATAYAAFVKESRKKRAGATKLHRKSGKRVIRVETRSRSAKALLPRMNAGAPTMFSRRLSFLRIHAGDPTRSYTGTYWLR